MHNPAELAVKHSLRCFFNSYLRDTAAEYSPGDRSFIIPHRNQTLVVRLETFSLMGSHRYTGELELDGRSVSFLEAVEFLCGKSEMVERVKNSVEVMETIIHVRQDEVRPCFLEAEQGLLVGHNFHPAPKGRSEFTSEDSAHFSPEFKAVVRLDWFFVHDSILWKESSSHLPQDWVVRLYGEEGPRGFTPVPMHPWQREKLLSHPVLKAYVDEGLILPGRARETLWYPTSSLRSLYARELPYMLKFSLSVRLTNSLRHMQAQEVVRGMQVQDALFTKNGREFTQRFPSFKVMNEPLAMGIKNAEGVPLPESIVLLRENPYVNGDEESVVLATLLQDHPHHGYSMIRPMLAKSSPQIWFHHFLQNCIKPLLVLHGDHGLMLGAHQQNLVIHLSEGLPVGASFRDCQGTGVSALGLELMRDIPSPEKLRQLYVPEEVSTILFTYYLVINSVMSAIHVVAFAGECEERHLVKMFREFLQTLSLKDASVVNGLLRSPDLFQKGNFRCNDLNINENTISDPLVIYNKMKNPFYDGASL